MNLTTRRITAHTRHPFRIARPGSSVHGSEVHRVIVRVEHEGICGFGEAAPAPRYSQSVESVETAIRRINEEGFLPPEPRASARAEDSLPITSIIQRLIVAFDDQRAAIAAVDAALHDWLGKRQNMPVWRLLDLDPDKTPPTSMTIGLAEPEGLERKVAEAAEFGILKIKVGTDRDEEILTAVRRLAPNKRLRLDANEAWSLDSALERIQSLARFTPECIEQPIPAGELDALREIHRRSPIPIFVDEDCARPDDIPRLAGCATGVNIKLAKCGGICEALRMIELAREFSLEIMLGCMVETSLGIAAAAQIASLADHVDLDGHLLLADDPFTGLTLRENRVLPGNGPGLGVSGSGDS